MRNDYVPSSSHGVKLTVGIIQGGKKGQDSNSGQSQNSFFAGRGFCLPQATEVTPEVESAERGEARTEDRPQTFLNIMSAAEHQEFPSTLCTSSHPPSHEAGRHFYSISKHERPWSLTPCTYSLLSYKNRFLISDSTPNFYFLPECTVLVFH